MADVQLLCFSVFKAVQLEQCGIIMLVFCSFSGCAAGVDNVQHLFGSYTAALRGYSCIAHPGTISSQ